MGADPAKIKVVYEGVSFQISNSKSQISNNNQILNKYNLQKQKYILFIGTVQPRKNLARLVKAFGRLRRSDLKLVIAGKLGWSYQDVLETIKTERLAETVVITGYVSDADRDVLLHNAVVYVQPSITEGFGLPVLEAMAAGCPVVSSNGGALAEIANSNFPHRAGSRPAGRVPNNFQNGRGRNSSGAEFFLHSSTGLRPKFSAKGDKFSDSAVMFDPFDIDQIAGSLKLVIENSGLRRRLIANGFERVKEFSWEKAAIETYNILVNSS